MESQSTLKSDNRGNVLAAPEASPARTTPLAKRQHRLLIITCCWALLSTAGLVASRWIKSPEQLAAETRPPPPTVLTAQVEHRVLIDSVVTRGTVAAQRSLSFTPLSAFGADRLIVTRIQKRLGELVTPGDVLLEVSGRPLIALPGRIPAYRDLREGQKGQDVAQLQRALRSLGFRPGKISGTLNAATAAAVNRFYASVGYTPAVSGDTPVLPLSEVMFLPAFPARVRALSSEVGDELQMPLITVSAGPLTVMARINPAEAGLVKAGMQATIDADLLGLSAVGSVTAVGAAATDRETGERYVPVRIVPSRPLDNRLDGQDVLVTIEQATTGSPVLIVPVSSIYVGSDGRTYVGKLDPQGREIRVPIAVGITAAGFSQVSPESGSLAAGDRVVVGR